MKQVIEVTDLFLFFTSNPLTPFSAISKSNKGRGKLNLIIHLLERKKHCDISKLDNISKSLYDVISSKQKDRTVMGLNITNLAGVCMYTKLSDVFNCLYFL